MASVSIKRGTKEEIDATNVNDGQILFTTDQAQNKIYADVGEVRKQIGGTVEVIDNLTSNDTDKALSANMGKTLSNSSNISYSNSTSGLSATNVQSAINELNVNKASKSVATTSTNGLMSSTDKTKLNGILGLVYPVGAIYMSVSSTSPATLFGGTWTQIKDRFLLSAGNTYKNGATGGEATHKLTTNELPHLTGMITTHGGENGSIFGIASGIFKSTSTISSYKSQNGLSGGSNAKSIPSIQADFGGDTAHNNMPPYLAVYVWKRTA